MKKFKPEEQDPRFRYSNEGCQTGLNWDYYWGRAKADVTKRKVRRRRAKVKGPVLKKRKG